MHGLHRRLHEQRSFSSVDIELSRAAPGLEGLTIAFISDLHAGCFMNEDDVARVFESVANAEPDLVCLGGDLIEHRPEDILLLGKGLALLAPPLGVFAIPGNHEYHAEPDLLAWRSTLEESGIEILLNRGIRLMRNGAPLFVAGVDDLGHGQPDLECALQDYNDDDPILLLAHHPDFFYEASDVGVDLTLSGHTHGGQIRLAGWAPFTHSKHGYAQGHFIEGPSQLYVGRGAGATMLPLRIGAPAEIPLIRILTPQ